MLDPVDDHGERKECQHADADDRTDVGDPLTALQRDDRHSDADPDENRLECDVAERPPGADVRDVVAPRFGGDEGKRTADPKWVRDPVEDGSEARPKPA